MRKILLLMMTGVSLCITTAKAQFNTVAVTPTRYKIEVLDMGLDQAEPALESEISIQEVSTGIPVSADMDKKKWMDRYLSVSYPLRYIKVTSPYGYRKDPFTGKSKFHGGLDFLLPAGAQAVGEVIAQVIGIVAEPEAFAEVRGGARRVRRVAALAEAAVHYGVAVRKAPIERRVLFIQPQQVGVGLDGGGDAVAADLRLH